MEQDTKKVKVSKVEDKAWQGKPFLVALTNEGEFTCWKPEMFGLITAAKNSGEEIEIELTKSAKGKWSITGIGGVMSAPKRSFGNSAVRDAKIETNIVRKENSIVEAAIRRDAVIFTSICNDTFGGEKRTDEVKKAHEYWLSYFRELYLG